MAAPVLIVGCGDLGGRVARRLVQEGRRPLGIVRSRTTLLALAGLGIDAQALDLDAESPAAAAADVFWFAPPPDRGHADPRLRRFLDASTAPPRRIVYVSTSGVYGDCDGRWIDEDEPLGPKSDRGRRRLDAEQALAAYAARTGTPVVILRVPGIYGPGRLPRERLERGLPVVTESASPWTNRIHIDDLATIALAALERGRPGAAYNASDGHPTTMTDYFVRCARILGLPEPPRISLDEARATFTPALLSFLDESRRLDNRRMREELGVSLRYPDLDRGLPGCMPG